MYESFHKYIQQAASKYNFTKTLKAIDICNTYNKAAEELLPPRVAATTRAKSYKDGILTLTADNSSAAQLLHMHKHRLLEAIAKRAGQPKIKEIKIELKC
jgi:predicted nucleic acid-binding Zn ribbon protein